MVKLDNLLYQFLVEESGMPVGKFNIITEDVKTETILQIANEILTNISDKLDNSDSFAINKSRGEIKNYQDLRVIQDTINKLKSLCNEYDASPELKKYLDEITKSIYNLNRYAPQFRDAYRAKKTVLMLRYQSIILAIISSLSYLVSAVIDFKNIDNLKLKNNYNIEEILPIEAIIKFNKSVEDGTFDSIVRDTGYLREFYNEYSIEDMSVVHEAIDITNLINRGIDSFSNFFNNSSRNGIIFKALGVVMAILSLRDIFYSINNSRIAIKDKIGSLQTFLNIDKLSSLSAVSRFITFNNKNAAESTYASNAAKQEIAAENKQIINAANNKPSTFEFTSVEAEHPTDDKPVAADDNIFDGFNF